jgi:hypothetical protein
MKRAAFLFIALILSSTACGQMPAESQRFLTESLNQMYLDKEELLPQFTHFDYSSLWTKYDKEILGFIGSDYQRLRIKYLAVVKNAEIPSKYYIYGKRKVQSDVCLFMGEIELIHARMFSGSEAVDRYYDEKNDEDTGELHSYPEYILLAEYRFFENPNQEGSGVLEGILRTDFYVDSGEVFYDDLEGASDGWCNNQYVGTWTSYKSGVSERCNWGEWRIPYSGDLDQSAAEFRPNTKYLDRGWDSYSKAFNVPYDEYDTTARRVEEEEWWLNESPPAIK